MATISLCMIVRDEESLLPACLASVAGAVDEIVVVDTGSKDATIALARAAGARVFEQAWSDDFSAPRNRAIAECACDWVLVLDADERLTQGAREALRRAVAEDDFDCGMLRLSTATRLDAEIDAVARGTCRVGDAAYLPRLMRRTPDLRFTGIVHENVGEWLFSNGRRPKLLPSVDIVHLGAVPDLRALRDKSRRNIRLLERACAETPNDVAPYGYLAHEYFDAGDRARAREVADRGWAVLVGGAKTLDLPALRLVTARAWLEVQAGEPNAALETMAVATRLLADHPDVFFIRGCASEMVALQCATELQRRDYLEAALVDYVAAIGCVSGVYLQKFIEGGAGWAAQIRRGTVLLLLGREVEALAAFDCALAENATACEARWGRVEALLACGETTKALREVTSQLDDKPDGWTLAALAAEAAGSFDAMGQWLAKAQSLLGGGFVAPHRRERYHDALVALGSFLDRPVSAPGPLGQLAELASGGTTAVTGAMARGLRCPITRGTARRLVAHWLRAGKLDKVERLVEPAAERLLPGILALTTAVVDELTDSRDRGGPRP